MSKQNKYLDVMIDIETASTKYDACVLSIGIVKFNLFDSEGNYYELPNSLPIDTKYS